MMGATKTLLRMQQKMFGGLYQPVKEKGNRR